jgi:hypothetical protein
MKQRYSAAIILAILFCVGCVNIISAPKKTKPSAPKPVTFKQIANSTHSGFARPDMGIISTEKELREFWAKLYARFSPPPSCDTDLIDFSKETVVYVAVGERPNGCYSAKISSITRQAEKLTVSYDECVPDKGCICTQVITAPVDVVKIGKIEKNSAQPEFIRNVVPVNCP